MPAASTGHCCRLLMLLLLLQGKRNWAKCPSLYCNATQLQPIITCTSFQVSHIMIQGCILYLSKSLPSRHCPLPRRHCLLPVQGTSAGWCCCCKAKETSLTHGFYWDWARCSHNGYFIGHRVIKKLQFRSPPTATKYHFRFPTSWFRDACCMLWVDMLSFVCR